MAVSKVILNGNTLIDVTDKTVTSSTLVSPNTALGADGTTVTGALVTKSASDVTVSGATTTIPAGVYSSQVQKTVNSGSATTPATTIMVNPSISVSSNGLITVNANSSQRVTPSVNTGYVRSGTAGTITVSGSKTQQLTVQAAQTITPTTTNQTIASGRYLTGTQTIEGDANLVASNIKKDVQIFGVTGSYEGSAPTINLQSKSASPTTSSQTITADSGYDGLSSVTVNAMPSGSISLERTRGKNESVVHTLDSDNGQLIESVRYTIEAHADVTPGYIQYSRESDTPCRFTNYYTFDNQVPATVYTPTTYDQRIMTKGCFITGTQTVKGDSNLTSYNIKDGVTIFGVTGSYTGDTHIFDYSSDVEYRGFVSYNSYLTFIADWGAAGCAWISGYVQWDAGAEVGEIDFTGIDGYDYLIDQYTDTFWLINASDPTDVITQGTYSDGVFSVDASYIADPQSSTRYYLVQVYP